MLKFSVVTPSYNQGEFISQTIESVLNQKYSNFEHIIIDGGSTDGTIDILKSYPHLIWKSEKDNGQTDALNKALRLASGDVIAWINSDDWYCDGAFNEVSVWMKEHPVVYGKCYVVDRQGNIKEEVPNYERTVYDMLRYWCSYSIPTQPAIFFNRSLLKDIQYSDGVYLRDSYNYCMDYDLWIRIMDRFPNWKRINKYFACYRMYETNKTGGGMAPAVPEMSEIFKRYETILHPSEFEVSIVVESESELTKARDRFGYNPKVNVLFFKELEKIPDILLGKTIFFLSNFLLADDTYINNLKDVFKENSIGTLLCVDNISPNLISQSGELNVLEFLKSSVNFRNLAIRKATFATIQPLYDTDNRDLFFKHLVANAYSQGWKVRALQVSENISLNNLENMPIQKIDTNVLTAKILSQIHTYLKDPFARQRLDGKFDFLMETNLPQLLEKFL